MHPNDIRKAKALVWYWLNNHPAEIYHSPTEGQEQGFVEDNLPYDMIVQNARKGSMAVGNCVSDRLYTYVDPDRWHGINMVIFGWYADLWDTERKFAFDYLKAVKGEPIDRWKYKYTRLPAPDWKTLVQRFISKGYIKVTK